VVTSFLNLNDGMWGNSAVFDLGFHGVIGRVKSGSDRFCCISKALREDYGRGQAFL
jgi:hypothetical protein